MSISTSGDSATEVDQTRRNGRLLLRAGVPVTLRCSSEGSRPPAVIFWYKDGEDMSTSAKIESSVVEDSTETANNSWPSTLSTLEFIPRPEDDGKRVICRAENPAIANSYVRCE